MLVQVHSSLQHLRHDVFDRIFINITSFTEVRHSECGVVSEKPNIPLKFVNFNHLQLSIVVLNQLCGSQLCKNGFLFVLILTGDESESIMLAVRAAQNFDTPDIAIFAFLGNYIVLTLRVFLKNTQVLFDHLKLFLTLFEVMIGSPPKN